MTTTLDPVAATAPEIRRPTRRSARAGRSPGRRALIYTARVVLLVGFLALWEFAAHQKWVDPLLFGQPSGIWKALREYLPSDRHLASLKSTFSAIGLSFVIGSVLGTVFGLVLGLSPTFDAIVGPFMTPINSVPRIALAPLFIAWFGLTMTAKVVRSVDPDLMTMARVSGLRRVGLLVKVVLPSAVPTIFVGLRLTFTYALLGVIASEMIAATAGLGQDIVFFTSSYQINTTYAILVELMVIAVVVTWLFALLERRLLRWQG
jgi:NitT/TauT family transport system permease protein